MVIGGMSGDFIKGRLDNVPDRPVRLGVELHRRIDTFTDRHQVPARSRARIVGPRRRYAGIITDMVYDHFLVIHWSRFAGSVELPRFTRALYQILSEHQERLPDRFRNVLPRMREGDWLSAYGELEVIGWAIDRIATRVRHGAVLRGAIEEVELAYGGLETDFLEFFPELAAFADLERRRLLGRLSVG